MKIQDKIVMAAVILGVILLLQVISQFTLFVRSFYRKNQFLDPSIASNLAMFLFRRKFLIILITS